jgi:hypothetical protein
VTQPGALAQFVSTGHGAALVLHDESSTEVAAQLARTITLDPVQVHRLDSPSVRRGEGAWGAVVVLVDDKAALRAAVSLLPAIGNTRIVAVGLAHAEGAVTVAARHSWPAISGMQARRVGEGAFTGLRFEGGLNAAQVLAAIALGAAPTRAHGLHGLHLARSAGEDTASPGVAPGITGVPALNEQNVAVVPADVWLGTPGTGLTEEPVTGRRPLVVDGPQTLVGPLDEAVLNARGYTTTSSAGTATLTADGTLTAPDGALLGRLDARGVLPRHVRALRTARSVDVQPAASRLLRRASGESGRTRATWVAGLALAGVPVIGAGLEPDVLNHLGPKLTAALATRIDLDDDLQRDEQSVRLRRAAFLEHSAWAWRKRLAAEAGLDLPGWPSVSVLLPTMRPAQLEFAIRQVARQRDVPVELILATHGHAPDAGLVRDLAGDLPVVLRSHHSTTRFGAVLADAAAAASGSVLVKMDDDDWYSPHALLDLLIARHHSGADLVGMTSEIVYVDQLDATIRRSDDSERDARFVAGGTMMLDAALLADVGGFRPVNRFVDAQLLRSLHAAGASMYRTQGLGYVYRRTAGGHTWDPGLDYFLDESRLAWRRQGFAPSSLLEVDPRDVPRAAVGGPA